MARQGCGKGSSLSHKGAQGTRTRHGTYERVWIRKGKTVEKTHARASTVGTWGHSSPRRQSKGSCWTWMKFRVGDRGAFTRSATTHCLHIPGLTKHLLAPHLLLIFLLLNTLKACTDHVPTDVFCRRKLRFREVKGPVQGHPVRSSEA